MGRAVGCDIVIASKSVSREHTRIRQVSANRTLNVSILGSGNVVYSGSPKMNVNIAGSGKVKRVSQ
jgi:pSer/pThr/pTyr-binding forkhead associated (FHA) protein